MFTAQEAGTVSFSTPTWNIDPATGTPYAEVTMTTTALAGGFARGRFEIHATTVSGGGARFPLLVGDELQGTGRVVVDDGFGNPAAVQGLALRQRLFSDSKFSDDGTAPSTLAPSLNQVIDRRFFTPIFATATASAGISAPSVGAGYPLTVMLEVNALGTTRVRVYAPSLRVVSAGGPQPTQSVAGASPATYTNTSGSAGTLFVSGGTVSAIAFARQGSTFATGATAGGFRLAQNDSVTITHTGAPTLVWVPDEVL